MSQRARTKLQRILDAFREARYPGDYPTSRNEDALARRLMSELKDWCFQQGLAAVLEEAEKEPTFAVVITFSLIENQMSASFSSRSAFPAFLKDYVLRLERPTVEMETSMRRSISSV